MNTFTYHTKMMNGQRAFHSLSLSGQLIKSIHKLLSEMTAMSITELLRKILVILIQLVIRILERQIHLKMSLILTLPYIIIQCIHGKTTVLFSKTIMLVPIGSSQILWAKIQDMQNTISKYWLKIIIFQLYLHIQNFRRHRFQCLRFFLMNARN